MFQQSPVPSYALASQPRGPQQNFYYQQPRPQYSGFQPTQTVQIATPATSSRGSFQPQGSAGSSGSQHRRGRGQQRQGRGRGQAFAVAVQEDAGRNVVDGMLLISQSWAHVLFDTGATHSFVSVSLVQALQLDVENCDRPLVLSTPMGGLSEVTLICKMCHLFIEEHRFSADLFVLPMSEFDVILGMDWLTKYQATVDCYKRRVILRCILRRSQPLVSGNHDRSQQVTSRDGGPRLDP